MWLICLVMLVICYLFAFIGARCFRNEKLSIAFRWPSLALALGLSTLFIMSSFQSFGFYALAIVSLVIAMRAGMLIIVSCLVGDMTTPLPAWTGIVIHELVIFGVAAPTFVIVQLCTKLFRMLACLFI